MCGKLIITALNGLETFSRFPCWHTDEHRLKPTFCQGRLSCVTIFERDIGIRDDRTASTQPQLSTLLPQMSQQAFADLNRIAPGTKGYSYYVHRARIRIALAVSKI